MAEQATVRNFSRNAKTWPLRLKLSPAISRCLNWQPKTRRARCLWAGASGLLLTLAFPPFNLSAMAWIAPGVLLLATAGATPRIQFSAGYVAGFVHFLSSLYWLLHIPFPQTAWLGWLALSAYCALYFAMWTWLCWKLSPVTELKLYFDSTWWRRQLWLLQCAAAWAALEYLRGWMLTGFPWNYLGVSHFQTLPLIQIASVTGVLGVSFLLVWFSAAMLCTGASILLRPVKRGAWLMELSVALAGLMGVAGWGFVRTSQSESEPRHLRVALVQPSVPQKIKFNPEENAKAFRSVLELSGMALAAKPDLLIWPEAVVPGFLRHDNELVEMVSGLARTNNVWILLGADDAKVRADDTTKADYSNSAFLVAPDGRLSAQYDKRHLVMFGEYVPLANWLPFLKWFTPTGTGFTPGTQPGRFEMPHPIRGATLSPLICFEDLFSQLAREGAAGADILVNLTNDGWFGESAEQWQHAANAVFRAVETGRPLVRCTNNGLTCWVDPHGRVQDAGFDNARDIHSAGFKIVRIPIGARGQTFYLQYGDWFAGLCVAATAAALLWRFVRERMTTKKGWAAARATP